MSKPYPQVWKHKPGLKTATIVLDQSETHTQHLELRRGFNPAIEVVQTPTSEFIRTFVRDLDTPIDKVAEIWKQHAVSLGASAEAVAVIGRFVNIEEGEAAMAATKSKTTPPVKKGPPAKATAPAKTEKPTKAEAPPKEKKEKPPSAASRFQELIMNPKVDGKLLNDDEIFAIVQKEHGLPDSKRSYVSWYRNYLKKQGKAPPPPAAAPEKPEAKKTDAAPTPAKSGPPVRKGPPPARPKKG